MKSIVAGGVAAVCAIVSAPCRAQDPTAVGPHAVLTAEYNRGDAAFTCPAGTADCDVPDAEIRGEVYYPSDLNAGPFPLVVFLHGRHSACYDPTTGLSSNDAWSQGCDPPFVPIPSYRGYDYIGKVLASHGYIVASISANGINGQDLFSSNQGIVARAFLLEEHLNIWNQFNTTGSSADGGPFAADFIGHVDLNNIGTMGHSRGGDGVVKHFARFAASSPFHVKAVLPIAPTNFSGQVISNVDLGVLLSYCDGDVYTLEGSLFYDRARYLLPNDESTKHTFLSLGSNHNFFNTAWTPQCWTSPGSCWTDNRGAMPSPATVDDGDGSDPFCTPSDAASGRLTAAEQRTAGLAYVAAFFRHHLGGETGLLPFLRGDVDPPVGLPADDLHAGYHAPASRRRDLNRLDNASELTQTTLVGDGGVPGAVSGSSLQTYERCGFDSSSPCFPGTIREVHWTNFASLDPRLSRVRNAWNDPTDSFVNELPPGARDISAFDVFQFRVGVDYTDADNPSPVVFSVTLNDGTNSATVATTSQLGSDDLYEPPGAFFASTVMNSLRLPLSSFVGVDLHNIQSVVFDYDETANGTILLSDLAFVDDEEEETPVPPACQAGQSFIVGPNGSVTTPDGSTAVFSSGSGLTRIDAGATTNGIISVGAVQVGAATINGNILSAGAATVASTASVSGTVTQFGSVSLPPLPTLPAFPAPVGPNRFINPGPVVTLAPGSYPSVTVNSGGVLQLNAGDYYFRNLTINSVSSVVRVNPATRVFVRDGLAYRAPFVSSAGAVVPVFLGYAGTADLRMEAAFDGTLVAPSAHVFFGIGSGLTYTGSFFARILEVNPQSDLVCIASGGGAASCSDGVKNGSETDVDCGGGTCAACSNGRSCSVATDCTSGTCTGGVCVQPAPLTVTFDTVTNWPGGYCVNLRVTNNATQPTTNFGVTFNTNQSAIYDKWNATFSGTSGVVTASPQTWNRVIAPGATNTTVGFCANRNTSGSGVLPFVVSSTATF